MRSEFRNEALTDFELAANAAAFEAALKKVQGYLGSSYPLTIGGEQVRPGATFNSINPSDPDQVVGEFAKADVTLARRAIEAADNAFPSWAATSAAERARFLFQAAAEVRARKHEFSAIMVYEVGKSWPEADADTAEAIDFLEFYAREMLRLSEPQPLTRIPSEDNELYYIPLGVGVVIPPWNFPFAIMAGMTGAALVAGNTVVLKPASTSPLIAYKFCEVLWNLGLPPGVLNFAPGPGGSMGDALVSHPRTRFIAFTGSREVGLHIHELASKHQPGQLWIKRTILEMGGKDAVIVDASADLEAAAASIVASAFGFQGQKCSAGSRAIIHNDVYEDVMADVVARTKKLKVGDPTQRDTFMGPVIDKNAFGKHLDYIEVGTQEGKLLAGGHRVGDKGYFIEPTIFGDVPRSARIATEEIFGPVLTCLRGSDFDDLIAIGNGTEYGLTGAVYSNTRAHLERARYAYHVGNLYFNRKCTGALVGVHPFGGFNMSGTDSKAGGRDYLLLFTQAKLVSEKL